MFAEGSRPSDASPAKCMPIAAIYPWLFLQCAIGVVFAGIVVAILADRLVRCQLLQPSIIVLAQAGFIVVDEHRCRDAHGIYRSFTITTTTLAGWKFLHQTVWKRWKIMTQSVSLSNGLARPSLAFL